METPVNQIIKYLGDNTNLFLATDVTQEFKRIEKLYVKKLMEQLYEEIKHGDAEHCEWLQTKLNVFTQRINNGA